MIRGLIWMAHVVLGTEFEYIVVGGGTGGGTLAVELAQRGFRTLLMEAGPRHTSPYITTPAFNAIASEEPEISFGFDVKHYTSGTLAEKTYFYPRVGALGGCSIHNAMIALLPNERDFSKMVKVSGDAGFSKFKMLDKFKKMERNQYQYQSESVDWTHGYRGWFHTSFLSLEKVFSLDLNLIKVMLATLGRLWIDPNGYNILTGLLNTSLEGNIFIPQAVDARSFERTDFLGHIKKAEDGGNLVVWTDTFAAKLILESGVVTGVEYRKGKFLYKASPKASNNPLYTNGTVFAKREVIVSGGAFNTPQLLMLSGIGDKEHLKAKGIEPRVHLPGVGRNLMDRYEVAVVSQLPRNLTLLEACKFIADPKMDPCYRDYIVHKKGPYTLNGVISGSLKKSSPSLREPDLFTLNTLTNFHGYYRGYAKDIANHKDRFSQILLKAHTSHKGYVKLNSNDPLDPPDINFNYFSNGNRDLEILIKAIKRARKVIRNLGHKEIYPGRNYTSNLHIEQYIRESAWGHHACCTSKMGKDRMAVIDGRFRVHQVKGLRVVDASSFPAIPGYFPALYIHMMAMRAADLIVQDATLKQPKSKRKFKNHFSH